MKYYIKNNKTDTKIKIGEFYKSLENLSNEKLSSENAAKYIAKSYISFDNLLSAVDFLVHERYVNAIKTFLQTNSIIDFENCLRKYSIIDTETNNDISIQNNDTFRLLVEQRILYECIAYHYKKIANKGEIATRIFSENMCKLLNNNSDFDFSILLRCSTLNGSLVTCRYIDRLLQNIFVYDDYLHVSDIGLYDKTKYIAFKNQELAILGIVALDNHFSTEILDIQLMKKSYNSAKEIFKKVCK